MRPVADWVEKVYNKVSESKLRREVLAVSTYLYIFAKHTRYALHDTAGDTCTSKETNHDETNRDDCRRHAVSLVGFLYSPEHALGQCPEAGSRCGSGGHDRCR